MCQLHLKPERKKINTAFVNSEKKGILELTSFFSLTTDISFISIGSDGKASAYNAGDLGSVPGSGRSPGEGNGNPLQYSCLENPMDSSLPGFSVHRISQAKIWEVCSCEPAVCIKHWSYLHKCPFGVLEYLKSRSADECEHYRHCI